MLPFYRLLIKRAWRLSLKYKWLWLFGIFAALLGQGGVYEFIFRIFNNLSTGQSLFYTLQEYANSGILGMISWGKLQELWVSDLSGLAMGIFSLLFALCLLGVMISLSVIGQAGLVKGAIGLQEGKKLGIKECFREGLKHFWSVLEINFITKVVLLGLLLLITYIVSLIPVTSTWGNTILFAVFFVFFVVVGIIIYFLTLYGTAYAVLRGQHTFQALNSAWKIFKKNIVANLEMGAIVFILNIVIAIGASIGAFIVLAPFILIYFILLFTNAALVFAIYNVFMIALVFVVFLALCAWYNTFQVSLWIMLFEELALDKVKPKIVRVLEHWSKK